MGEKIKGNGKKAWKDRCKKFAGKYFNGDLRQLTYCMKDVYNWKEWVDMNREYKDVDFTNVIEETNNVQPEQETCLRRRKMRNMSTHPDELARERNVKKITD